MEPKNFNYSLKNIPIAGKLPYMKRMFYHLEHFFGRCRWKLFFFKNKHITPSGKKTYGFKTSQSPDPQPELRAFECDLYDMVRNIQFNRYSNDFQKQLKKDVKEIQASDKVYVSADKTTNIYPMDKDKYLKLRKENVTKCYKTTCDSMKHDIDREAKNIATKLEIADRMEVYAEREAFITLKDHKEDFRSNPKCRLINPAKSEMGIVCKQIIEKICDTLRKRTGYNQWKSTQSMLDWFTKLPNRDKRQFLKFDIVEFYPSITEKVLKEVLAWVESILPDAFSSTDLEILWNSRKSLLFSGGKAWQKSNDGTFDVTMGSYDGAEICELVGLFLLSQITLKIDKKFVGLYRDDGLSALDVTGPQAEKLKKQITTICKKHGFGITVEKLTPQTDFLEVTLNLHTGKFWPYRKPNDVPLYVNSKSNHPPCIIKHLPSSINSRVSSVSCDSESFNNAKPLYEDALKKSGYTGDMSYTPKDTNSSPSKRKRKRNIIWFNPPFNANIMSPQTLHTSS